MIALAAIACAAASVFCGVQSAKHIERTRWDIGAGWFAICTLGAIIAWGQHP